MLSNNIENALNDQIKIEAESSQNISGNGFMGRGTRP